MALPYYESQWTAQQIEDSIGKSPRINAQSYWEVWDIINSRYVNTGVLANAQAAATRAEQAASRAAESASTASSDAMSAAQSAVTALGYAGDAQQAAADAQAAAASVSVVYAKYDGDEVAEDKFARLYDGLTIGTGKFVVVVDTTHTECVNVGWWGEYRDNGQEEYEHDVMYFAGVDRTGTLIKLTFYRDTYYTGPMAGTVYCYKSREEVPLDTVEAAEARVQGAVKVDDYGYFYVEMEDDA